MRNLKRPAAGALAGLLVLSLVPTAFASTAHFNDSSATGGSAAWTAWTSQWESVAADYTKVSLTPGAEDTQLNFAWYAKDSGKATPVVHFGTDKTKLQSFSGVSSAVDSGLTGGEKYVWNHVTVTGLRENTSYWYTVEKNGVQTTPVAYKTGSFENVTMLYVGDPQIGASKGQSQNGEKLAADSGAKNTAARNDAFAWNRTLALATSLNPNVNFIISAGDQINKTGKPKEEEYAGYLSPAALASLPVATTIGNHDSLNSDYSCHFDNPNATQNGKTAAGGDYYYSYGPGLFIVLNTNNYNAAEHEKTVAQAVAACPDAKWRIVTIHQDIYGSGLDHSDTDGMILRTQLTPIFDKYDIDVVLQGHDHTYSRSKLLYGDGQTHGTYKFRLAADGSDYDWDNAYNTKTNAKIGLYPKADDAAGQSTLADFTKDNHCYTLESVDGSSVTDPAGTLYMTANSGTGSKYYELATTQQDYIAKRSQNWLPSYSVIGLSADNFTISTYQITAAGKAEQIDKTFTINKDDKAAAARFTDVSASDWYVSAVSYGVHSGLFSGVSTTSFAPAQSMTRAMFATVLYRMAGSPAVSAAGGFADVSADAWYAKAVAWAKQNGVVSGVSETSFAPDEQVTREQAMTILCRYAKSKGAAVTAPADALKAYSDAGKTSAYALDAMKWAVSQNILSGYSASELAPQSSVTRAQLAAIVMRAAAKLK